MQESKNNHFEQSNDMNLLNAINAVQTMSKCNTESLSAAIAMLPEYHEDGAAIVLSAAARVIAEHFENTEEALDSFKRMVNKWITVINENNYLISRCFT